MDDPMVDHTGSLVVELRDNADVAAIAGARVRVREPHGATGSYPGDARGPGEWVAFVVLSALSTPPDRRVPVVRAEYAVRCYGADSEQARALFGAVVSALHDQGPRLRPDGRGIYRSFVTGGVDDTDPDTKQPVVTGTIQLIASTQVVTT